MTRKRLETVRRSSVVVQQCADMRDFATAFAIIQKFPKSDWLALFDNESVFGYDFFSDWLLSLDADCKRGYRSRNVSDFISLRG